MKKILIYMFILLILISSVLATKFDFNSKKTFDVGYEGNQKLMKSVVVENKNLVCSIKCTYTTNQGKSGKVPGVVGEKIPPAQKSYFSVLVMAKGSKLLTITVKCVDVGLWPLCSNSNSDVVSKSTTFTWDYCGDEIRNGEEICDNGNKNGKVCIPSYDSSCTYCSSACKLITKKGSYCGDNKKDSLENCKNCPDDTGCRDTEQCSSSGICINIVNDKNNCGAINNKCEKTRTETIVNSECSADNKNVIQTIKETWYSCKYKTCIKQEKMKKKEISCEDKFCQDGNCGCSEDYEVCEPLQKCVKKENVKLNQPCKCDFQCEEGFCDETFNQCVKGLNVKISSTNSALNVGEETTISLSVSNPLNKDVKSDITLSLGDGIELVEVLSGDQCSGSQCKLDKKIIPAGGKEDITIKVKANSVTTTFLNAFISYQLGSKKIEIEKETTLKIVECGNGKVEEGETSETCCIDAGCPSDNFLYSFSCNKKNKSCNKNIHSYYIYGSILVLILIFLIIFRINRSVIYHKSLLFKKNKKKKKKEEVKEEKQEERGSIAKEIEDLHSLMEKGVLTRREFKKKKKELLKKKV